MAGAQSDYDAIYKEIDKLDLLLDNKRGASNGKPVPKSKTKPITNSLDALLTSLNQAKAQLIAGKDIGDIASIVEKTVETSKKEIEDREKEMYNTLNKIGKAIDKKFPETLPVHEQLFVSPQARGALDRVITAHLMRNGDSGVANIFAAEARVEIDARDRAQFEELHRITNAMKGFDYDLALDWCRVHSEFLRIRHSPLAFDIHRSRYVHVLLAPSPLGGPGPALSYARRHFPALYHTHSASIHPLMSALACLPASRLAKSARHSFLLNSSLHQDLEKEFAKEYYALLKVSRQAPLRVVGDLGGGGALAKIERGKRLILDKKTEWSAADELPIEIFVPLENQYHSIFACPVSKEQSTESNPPMMLNCGHVLAKDSVAKMAKGASRIKCPYCPIESTSPPQRVFF